MGAIVFYKYVGNVNHVDKIETPLDYLNIM